MHVYLSLAVFFSRATEAWFGDFDAARCASRALQCHERALWLYKSAQPLLYCLSTSGGNFVAALGALSAQTAHDEDLLFFFNDTAPPEIYTLSLHDALPI